MQNEEQKLTHLLSRVMRNPNAPLQLKKQALDALLEKVKSPDPKIRVMCTKYLDRFINDFPELKERCIDSVYDACEDPVSDVRQEGYRAIHRFSKADHSLVRRNTDVLVQLLQNDEPEELKIIKDCLAQHLKDDAAASLQVLCDSCAPGSSEEDVADREQLRNLVIEFLTDYKNYGIRNTLGALDLASERVLIIGLSKAIPLCTAEQTELLVTQLLLPTKSISSAELSDALIDALASQITRRLEMRDPKPTKLYEKPSLVTLAQCSGSLVKKLPQCNPLPLFARLSSGALDRMRNSSPPWTVNHSKIFLKNLFTVASVILALDKNVIDWSGIMDKLVDKSPQILPTMLIEPIMWQEISTLLQAILDVSCFIDMPRASLIQRTKNSSWTSSKSLFDSLRRIEPEMAKDSESPYKQRCTALLKNLVPPSQPAKRNISEAGLSFVNAAQTSQIPSRNNKLLKRRHEEGLGSFAPSLSAQSYSTILPLASRLGLQPPSEPAAVRAKTAALDQQPPAKRARENSPVSSTTGTSLLSRMQNGTGLGKPAKTSGSASIGFSIKGAANTPSTPKLHQRLDFP